MSEQIIDVIMLYSNVLRWCFYVEFNFEKNGRGMGVE